ncbi:MAG: MBG domain-containing protein, partial [Cytophagales bacterium]|nr:MBG domain-containing protein [Cytophagales bacterium]
IIHKAPATVRLGDLEATYDGSPKRVTATTDPEGLPVHITYSGADAPPVNAGSYEVAGTIEDANYDGTARGQLVIHKAPATVRLGDLEATYDGISKPVTATTDPEGLPVHITYDGSDEPPRNSGNYEVMAIINDSNFIGSVYDQLTIAKAILTAEADDKIRVVGEVNPEFSITYSGFVNNETEEVINTKPIASCIADISSGPGVYEITLAGGQDNDYDFIYVSGELTINSITGLGEADSENYQIYPNPVLGRFKIATQDKEALNIWIYDLRGNLVYKTRPSGREVNARFLSPGSYILKVNNGFIKLIKK